MTKRGPARKPDDQKVDRRSSRTGALVAFPGTMEKAPPAPKDVSLQTRKRWKAYWASDVAKAAIEVDLPALERLFTYYDEWDRAMNVFRDEMYVEGSMKQPRINPIADHIARLEGLIGKLEAELGLTPYARAKLGISIGEAKKTLDDLNRKAKERGAANSDPRFAAVEQPPRDG